MRILGLIIVVLALLACRQMRGTPEEELINRTAEILNTKECGKLVTAHNADRAYACKVLDGERIRKRVEIQVYNDTGIAAMNRGVAAHSCKSLKAWETDGFYLSNPPAFVCAMDLGSDELEALKKSLNSI